MQSQNDNFGAANTTAPSVPANAAPANGAADWARMAHRALRGRYRLTVSAMLMASTAGVIGAWKLAGPSYRSDGMVRIASALPAVIKETDQNKPIPMFDSFIQAQQEMVTSRAVLDDAMQDPIWRNVPMQEKRPSIEEMAIRLKVEVKPRSENIRISFTDASAAMATAAVTSTINAYQNSYTRDHKQIE